MILTINGRRRELPAEVRTVAQLLAYLQLEAENVVVERNREILTAAEFDRTSLEENDVLELIQFVGGG